MKRIHQTARQMAGNAKGLRAQVREKSRQAAAPNTDGLTAREGEILVLMADGLSNKEIAQKANISAGTVRIHLGNIFKKLHVRSRTEAAAKYYRAR